MHKERRYYLLANTTLSLPVYGEVVVGNEGLTITVGQNSRNKYWAKFPSGSCYSHGGEKVRLERKGFAVNSSFESMVKKMSELKR